MEVKKQTKVYLETTDSKEMEIGKVYDFIVGGRTLFGTYMGINKSGSLAFIGELAKESVSFSVMPRTIDAIYERGV